MRRFALFLLLAGALGAQTAGGSVQATGTATIYVQPDQAQITVGVLTQAATAQEAAQSNAAQTTTVINALKSVLGSNGTLQTVGYSVYPRYSNSQPPTIVGYSASNSLQVTITNLNLVGSLIDTANQAGANTVSGISFGLQDNEAPLQQALAKAGKLAFTHAGAIAQGLGLRTGAVLAAQEGTSITPIVAGGPTTAATTPVQTGTVSVYATVTVSVQLQQ